MSGIGKTAYELAIHLSDHLTNEDDPNQWDVSTSGEGDNLAKLRVYGEFDDFKITIERSPRE